MVTQIVWKLGFLISNQLESIPNIFKSDSDGYNALTTWVGTIVAGVENLIRDAGSGSESVIFVDIANGLSTFTDSLNTFKGNIEGFDVAIFM